MFSPLRSSRANIALVVENLLADVLQRTHPVPIGSQSIKAETDSARGLIVQIKTLVNCIRINRRSQRIGPANEQRGTGHPDHDDQAQGDTLQALVVHLLFEVSPAEDECCRREYHSNIDQRIERAGEHKSRRRRATMSCRSNKTVVSKIRQQVIQTSKEPARAGAAQRDGESL